MIHILGVDAGGTKTTARITDSKGSKISESISGSGSFTSVGVKRAAGNLNKAIFEAMELAGIDKEINFKSSCFGFAGFNVPDDIRHYQKIVHNNRLEKNLNPQKSLIVNDTRIGLEAGSDAADLQWFGLTELPELAFDHALILADVIRMIREGD